MKATIWSVVLITVCASGVSADDAQKPDFASLDKAVLVILANSQYHEIQRLQAEVEDLKAKIGSEHGGSEAIVSGDVVAIDDGSWVVTVHSVSSLDITPLQRQIAELRERLTGEIIQGTYRRVGHQTEGVESRLRTAEKDLQAVLAKGKYSVVKSSDGHTVGGSGNPNGYRGKELRDARAVARRLRGEKRGIERKILGLERRIEVGRNTITAQATTRDGLPVTLTAAGVYVHVGRSFEEGGAYTVTGSGRFDDNSGKITLKTAIKRQQDTDTPN